MFDDTKANLFFKRSEAIRKELENKVEAGKELLANMRAALVGLTASRSEVVPIERVSNRVPKLRSLRMEKEKFIAQQSKEIKVCENEYKLLFESEVLFRKEIEKAKNVSYATICTILCILICLLFWKCCSIKLIFSTLRCSMEVSNDSWLMLYKKN
jgi:hypothetical protein